MLSRPSSEGTMLKAIGNGHGVAQRGHAESRGRERGRVQLPEEEAHAIDSGVRRVLLGEAPSDDAGEGEEASLLGFVLRNDSSDPALATSEESDSTAAGRNALERVAYSAYSELSWVQRRVKHIMRNDSIHARLYGDEGEVLELIEWMNTYATPELGGKFIVGARALSSVFSELEREEVSEFDSTDSKQGELDVDPVKRAICRLALDVDIRNEEVFRGGVDTEERDARLRNIGLAKAAICAGMPRSEMSALGLDMSVVDDLQTVNPFTSAGQEQLENAEDLISQIPNPDTNSGSAPTATFSSPSPSTVDEDSEALGAVRNPLEASKRYDSRFDSRGRKEGSRAGSRRSTKISSSVDDGDEGDME